MNFGVILLVALCIATLVSAGFAVGIGNGERARVRWFLAAALSLSAIFGLVGATTLALVLLLVSAGQGLVTFHAIAFVEGLDEYAVPAPDRQRVAPSHWLLIVLGIGAGAYFASAVWGAFADAGRTQLAEAQHALPRFREVARVVLVEHGFATLLVALLLLAVTVATGFLVARESGAAGSGGATGDRSANP